eukprot:TRINITY_DN6209_c0_g1_i3.p1 TRINITY_DN6209_c0_g1~~TRINITY_DN6209_c0_g1_i3.p1  ORF type:complete len:319 (+),score=62.18 TRINITY_DN6209_c0_g1_i3:74-1030(+)
MVRSSVSGNMAISKPRLPMSPTTRKTVLLPPGIRQTRSRFSGTPLEPIPGSPSEAASSEPLPTLLGSSRNMGGLPLKPNATRPFAPHAPGPIKATGAPAAAAQTSPTLPVVPAVPLFPANTAQPTAAAPMADAVAAPAVNAVKPVLSYDPPKPPAVLSYSPRSQQSASTTASTPPGLPCEIFSYGPHGEPLQLRADSSNPGQASKEVVDLPPSCSGQEAKRRLIVAEARQKELPLKVRVPPEFQTNPLVQQRLSKGLPVKKKPVYAEENAGVPGIGMPYLDPSLPAKKAESPFLLHEPVLVLQRWLEVLRGADGLEMF